MIQAETFRNAGEMLPPLPADMEWGERGPPPCGSFRRGEGGARLSAPGRIVKKIPAVVNWFTEFTEFPLRHFPAVVLLISCRQFTTSRIFCFSLLTFRRFGCMVLPLPLGKATRLLSQSGLSPPINPQDAESRSKSIFLLGYWRLREAGLITRQGVLAPTASAFFIARKDVRP